ncbi:retrotransposon protein, putative, ty1-copia subclass [Tanacetum coccineum]
MASSMSPKLQKTFENTWAYEMNQQLKEMFQAKASKECLDVVKYLMACKPKPEASICAFILEMKGYFDRLESLNMVFDAELSINIILSSLPADYNQFVLSYQMNRKETSIMELYSLLQTAEQGIKKIDVPSTSATPVLTVGYNVKKRKTYHSNWKGKAIQGKSDRGSKRKAESEIAPTSDPKEAMCFYYNTKGHWKRSCLKYLKDLKDGKVEKGGHSGSRRLKHREFNLVMGNRKITPVTRIRKYELMLKSGVRIDLNNCCYLSEMTRNIISFHALYNDGYKFSFDNENGDILVYLNVCFMFKASICKGIYETIECISNNGNVILNVGSSNVLDKSKLWHSYLGHVNKKHIAQLQEDGVLESFDFKSNDVCESCFLGKMTKSPFTGMCERGEGLLDLVHIDVCGPFRSTTKYGNATTLHLLMISVDMDMGGEYLSIEFFEHLKNYSIVSKLTSPRTPQLNSVAERRNRTLLDMVQSTMCRATLPISFWGYALETAAHILKLVPTKKVSKTPFEMWKGKQELFGYLFCKPKDDVVFVARRGVFLEREMISKEDSGSKIDFEEIQESANEEPIISDSTLSELDELANYKEAMESPKRWHNQKNLYFHEKVTQFGYSRSKDESYIYVKVSGSVVVFLVLYVDDILLIGNDIPTLQSVKDWLRKCFAIKDLGDAAYILGIKIYRDRLKRLIGLSQDTYLDKILKRFKMENSKKGNLPLHHGIKISKDLCPKTNEELDKMSRNPSEGHWTPVKNILKYLRNTKDMFLVYCGEEELRVTGYCDAS